MSIFLLYNDHLKLSLPVIFILVCGIYTPTFSQELSRDLQKEVESYQQEIDKYAQEGNKNQEAIFNNKIAYIYWENEVYQKAINYFNKSITLNNAIGNKNGIASINNNIGMIYTDMKQYDSSIPYFQKAADGYQRLGKKRSAISTLVNMSSAHSSNNDHQNAISVGEKALTISKELNDIKLLKRCYLMLSESYEKIGNGEKSFEYFNYYSSFQKKIQKEILKKNEVEMQQMAVKTHQVELEKEAKESELKEKEVKLHQTEETLKETEEARKKSEMELQIQELTNQQQAAEIEKETLIIKGFVGGVIILLLFGVYIFISLRQKQKANKLLKEQREEIRHQNESIKDSITYAQRIQEALLPDIKKIKETLPNSFVLFKPKDIVSGDFFFFNHLNGSVNKTIISAVDCTGHGVPGAFMSMIGMESLNKITRKTNDAGSILNKLHLEIRRALKQEKTENNDGMDLALCVIDEKNNQIEFSGAKNPMVYIKNGELNVIKGDKMPIGGSHGGSERDFNTSYIPIDGPTYVYLFSDGYQDQFGGPEGRKFMVKKMKELILEIHQKPFDEQKEILDKKIKDWKSDKYKQIDDILVLGFKVG